MADETLLTPARISKYNVHRIHGELKPEEAAVRYVEEIRDFFSPAEGELPAFDLIHRGMGSDAHTASLFPGEPLIGDRTGIAASVYSKPAHNYRVTLLPGVLLAAKRTVILAAGPDKAGPLKDVLDGPEDPFRYPCQIATRGRIRRFGSWIEPRLDTCRAVAVLLSLILLIGCGKPRNRLSRSQIRPTTVCSLPAIRCFREKSAGRSSPHMTRQCRFVRSLP